MSFKSRAEKKLEAAFAEADATSKTGAVDAAAAHEALVFSGSCPQLLMARLLTLMPQYGNTKGKITLSELKRLHAYLQKGHNVAEELTQAYVTITLLQQELDDVCAGRPPRPVREPPWSVRAWLEHLKPGFGRYAAAFESVGTDDVDDLINLTTEEAVSIRDELSRSGAKAQHLRRIVEAMSRVRGVHAPPDDSQAPVNGMPNEAGVPPAVSSIRMPSALLAAPLPLNASQRPSVTWATQLPQGVDRFAVRTSRDGGKALASPHVLLNGASSRGDGTGSMAMGSLQESGGLAAMPTPSVREWLDEVKAGFAAKFATAFEHFGIEDQTDLSNVDAALATRIFERLRGDCGGKELHVSVLSKALEQSGATGISSASALAVHSAQRPHDRELAAGKRFAAFISHHKRDAAMEARFLKERLEAPNALGLPVFLDSDELHDLRTLLDHVRRPTFLSPSLLISLSPSLLPDDTWQVRASEVLLLVQSSDVLLRPWCILEIHAAVAHDIPIVAVSLRGKAYDFAEGQHTLTYLDTELDRLNPGASATLAANGVRPIDAAYLLANVLPNILSLEFDPGASSNIISAVRPPLSPPPYHAS